MRCVVLEDRVAPDDPLSDGEIVDVAILVDVARRRIARRSDADVESLRVDG
jgi:hypothetical protein